MFNKIWGIMRLDTDVYEQVEHDQSATSQAAIIVFLTALLAAVSGFFSAQDLNEARETISTLEGLEEFPLLDTFLDFSPGSAALQGFIGVFMSWILWSAITNFVGTRLFDGEATFGEMLRVLGFAQAPRLLTLFIFIPCLGGLLSIIGSVWAFICGFCACRQGLDLSSGKALFAIFISWIVVVLINNLLLFPIYSLLPF